MDTSSKIHEALSTLGIGTHSTQVEELVAAALNELAGLQRGRAEVEEVRTAIGANEGESTIDAIHRYTFAVQLGCALKLEQHLDKHDGNSRLPSGPNFALVVAAWKDAIAFLREGIPVAVAGEAAPQNAVEFWKAEQIVGLKDALIDHLLPKLWLEVMGPLPMPPAALAKLKQLVEDFDLLVIP